MSIVQHDKLRYRHEDFAIHHVIADCPPGTAIREVLKNSLENVTQGGGTGRIEWFAEQCNGVSKLGLFNEGPGMSDADLVRLMDLASSGKTLGLDNNFGQGAKISGLRVSPAGLVYRSCRAGRVHEITLCGVRETGKDFLVYVKKRYHLRDEQGEAWETVVDVTDAYTGRADRPLDRDWTEVVFLGREALHDTVAELVPGATSANWLLQLINRRFYQFPPGVTVQRANLTTTQAQSRSASGLKQLVESHSTQGRTEDVPARHPRFGAVTLRYVKLNGTHGADALATSRANTMNTYGLGGRGDHVTLVWRGECYDLHTPWTKLSGAFGITFGSADVAVHVLLPDDAPVKNNTYRDQLLDRDGDHQPVRVEHFADVVRDNRPGWLREYIEQQANRHQDSGQVMERLQRLLDELKTTGADRAEVAGTGTDEGLVRQKPGAEGKGHGGGGRHPADPAGTILRPGTGKRVAANTGVPRVIFAQDSALKAEMAGRAAMYRREDNTVFLNPDHGRYQQDLNRLYQDVGADAERQQLAKKMYDEEYQVRAGEFVVLSWLFKGQQDWTDGDLEAALNQGSLTLHLASPSTLHSARKRVNMRFQTRKHEALAG